MLEGLSGALFEPLDTLPDRLLSFTKFSFELLPHYSEGETLRPCRYLLHVLNLPQRQQRPFCTQNQNMCLGFEQFAGRMLFYRPFVLSRSGVRSSGKANLVCPVRALESYFRRTTQWRLWFSQEGFPPTKHTFSRWIVDTVPLAYNILAHGHLSL